MTKVVPFTDSEKRQLYLAYKGQKFYATFFVRNMERVNQGCAALLASYFVSPASN